MVGAVPQSQLGESFRSFFDAVDQFFSSIAEVRLGALILGLLFFGVYLTLRARASFHILRAAYPDERSSFRDIWGAYFAGYGFNAVIPARGGDVVRLFLTKTSVPQSSYPAVAASFVVESVFDVVMGVFILSFAFTQGVFPKPPDLAKLNAFDLSYLASHPRFALFFITVAGRRGDGRVRPPLRPGQGVLGPGAPGPDDPLRPRALPPRGVRRAAAGLGLPLRRVLVPARGLQRRRARSRTCCWCWAVNAVAAAVPFTPQGAGVAQALLVKVFAGTASGATVAAYSVGQQIAIGAFTFAIGFAALFFIFRMRSFKEILRRGREDRDAEREAARKPAPSGT